jgi:predicted nucleic acid-binding protein
MQPSPKSFNPLRFTQVVLRDPDDDAVIACAVAAAANIVSGDLDLLAIKKYREIEIISAAEFIARFRKG